MNDSVAARLRVMAPDRGRREIELVPANSPLTIGRSPAAGLSFADDPEVSKLHATIEYMSGLWTVADDGLSRNGTFVNGERLHGRHVLADGDVVRAGGSSILFSCDYDDAEPTTAHPPEGGAPPLSRTQLDILIELCRPCKFDPSCEHPASNEQIAAALDCSISSVKGHLNTLFTILAIADLPPAHKRRQLAADVMARGIVLPRQL